MDNYSSQLVALGIDLTKLAVKGTATAVSNKIKAIREEKNTDKIRNTYDEIINELLTERDEAIRIAQSYKSELEKVVISDEDIEHLYKTVSRLLELLKLTAINEDGELGNQIDSFEQAKELISVDTLKTMQLLGFNYKAAIGEPLTIMLKNYLLSKAPKLEESSITPEMVEILKSNDAYSHFKELMEDNR